MPPYLSEIKIIMPKLIAIAGPSGSGKTTVSRKLMAHYNAKEKASCIIISTDNYYYNENQDQMTHAELASQNFDDPVSFDWKRMAADLRDLIEDKEVNIPVYDFKTHRRTKDSILTRPTKIIILEGILALHHDFIVKLFHAKIFVKTRLDYCVLRRIERDVAERDRSIPNVISQYKQTVGPMYEKYVKPSKNNADLILVNDELNSNPREPDFDIQPLIKMLEEGITSSLVTRAKPPKLSLFSVAAAKSESSEQHHPARKMQI
jgi:uridine kinase